MLGTGRAASAFTAGPPELEERQAFMGAPEDWRIRAEDLNPAAALNWPA
jgi:hypothetical protein